MEILCFFCVDFVVFLCRFCGFQQVINSVEKVINRCSKSYQHLLVKLSTVLVSCQPLPSVLRFAVYSHKLCSFCGFSWQKRPSYQDEKLYTRPRKLSRTISRNLQNYHNPVINKLSTVLVTLSTAVSKKLSTVLITYLQLPKIELCFFCAFFSEAIKGGRKLYTLPQGIVKDYF